MADSASGSNPNPSSSEGSAAPPRDGRSQLAHEMRNALSPLRTSLELLRLPQVGDAVKDEARAVMARQIDRLSQLVDRLEPRGAAPAGPPPAPASGCRVLLVDDNRLFLEAGAAMLEAEGYEVRAATDGEQAPGIGRAWRPRIALLDLHMRGIGGIETARRLRAEHPAEALTLLMMSGVAMTETWTDHARAAGFDDCIEKTAPPSAWLELLARYAQPK